jgi:hypothetical protein
MIRGQPENIKFKKGASFVVREKQNSKQKSDEDLSKPTGGCHCILYSE